MATSLVYFLGNGTRKVQEHLGIVVCRSLINLNKLIYLDILPPIINVKMDMFKRREVGGRRLPPYVDKMILSLWIMWQLQVGRPARVQQTVTISCLVHIPKLQGTSENNERKIQREWHLPSGLLMETMVPGTAHKPTLFLSERLLHRTQI